MPRPVSFKPRDTSQGWEINIPPSQSETGARRKIYFKSERAANIEAAKRKRLMKQHGAKALHIPADIAAQALKATATLEPYGVTITEVVRDWVARRDQQESSITLREAWQRGEEYRKGMSEETRRDYRTIGRNLPAWLLDKLCCDIGREDCERAVGEVTGGDTMFNKYLRYLSAIFADAIKDDFAIENPAFKVRKRKQAPLDVKIASKKDLKKLFSACLDYRKPGINDRKNAADCRPCAVPLAFLAFAGVRPVELVRLTWDDVSLELRNIRLPAPKAKTKTLRNIQIEDVLAAWIETVPKTERTGKIVPADWTNRRGLVFSKAGVEPVQDLLRHSYGSYHLATYGDLDALNVNMGHKHVSTYFNHYHNALTKREALPYWSIGPAGWAAKTIEEVA